MQLVLLARKAVDLVGILILPLAEKMGRTAGIV